MALLLIIYLVSNPERTSYYNHFVWQARAFLDGHLAIPFPVPDGPAGHGNELFQDVVPVTGPGGATTGYALLPFPPLPAILLIPAVAVWGLGTDAQLISAILGALVVGVAWWVLGGLAVARAVRVATTLFLALGTVFWYAAQLGTTWYLAHVVAVGLTLAAIGVAIRADPTAGPGDRSTDRDDGGDEADEASEADSMPTSAGRPTRTLLDGRQVLAGILLGLACTARLTVALGLPFFLLVGAGGDPRRRGLSAAVGMALPIGALLAFTYASTGHPLNPAYDALYRLEAVGYPGLGYHLDWGIEDPRYLVQNLGPFLAGLPSLLPACPEGTARGLFDLACPVAVPRDIGMGLFLTSPAWLVAFAALRRYGRDRVVTGAVAAVVLIAIVDLMHFSQGWVQFGYRFSLDYAPFGLLLLALAMEHGRRARRLGYVLIVVSVAVNAWGVAWGHLLGW